MAKAKGKATAAIAKQQEQESLKKKKAAQKKQVSESEESSSSEEESSDEESEEPAKPAKPAAKVKAAPAKKAESSSEEESSDEDSDEEEPAKPATVNGKAKPAAKESSEEESSEEEESSDEEEAKPAATKAASSKEESSEEESSDDEEMKEAEKPKQGVKRAADGKAKEESSEEEEESGEEESSDEEEEGKEEAKPAAKKKKAADGSAVDVSAANGSRTIFMKNLPWAAEEDTIREFFAECGPIAEVRIAYDRDTGRAKGFAHVQFEELEGAAKATALSGESLMDRELYIESTTERQQRTPGENRFATSDGTTIFVKGYDSSLGEDEVRRQLTEAFGEVGAVVSVRLPTDRDTGELKGIGFIEFESTDAKHKAVELDGSEVAGGWIKVDPNPSSGGGRSDFGGRGRGRGDFGGRGRGGRDGGRGGRGRGPRISIDAGGSGKKTTFED